MNKLIERLSKAGLTLKAKHFVKEVNDIIKANKLISPKAFEENQISDGYHTFEELYEFRKMYNACLFNEWASHTSYGGKEEPLYDVHKSTRHHDGELCFGGGWFIVSAMLPTGLISNHYKMKDWDLFQVPIVEKAKYEFDGHTGEDVLQRLKDLI